MSPSPPPSATLNLLLLVVTVLLQGYNVYAAHRADIKTCAVFFAYGGAARYENEVLNSIGKLKGLNPKVSVFLVTDNPDLQEGVDELVLQDRIPGAKRNWLVRLRHLASWSREHPSCNVTLSLDSHVTTCNSDLHQRMSDFFYNAGSDVGAAHGHAPRPPFLATPYKFWHEEMSKTRKMRTFLPHNFALIFKKSYGTDRLFAAWENRMRSGHGDDQVPLQLVAQSLRMNIDRQPPSFLLAFANLHAALAPEADVYPRITYVAHHRVTMIHSHSKKYVPKAFKGDICAFINHDTRDRMLVQKHAHSQYEMVFNQSVCMDRLRKKPKVCSDMGHFSTW